MRTLTLALLVAFLWGSSAQAAAPPFLHVQGSLATTAGTPSSGTFDLTVSLWTAESGGTQLHTQAFPSTEVAGGVFDVVLGQLQPAVLVDNAQVWLQVKVGTEAPLPRTRLLSVAFAIESGRAAVAAGAESVTCSGCIGTAQLGSDLTLGGDLTVGGGVTACASGAAGCGFGLADGAVVGRGGAALSLEADSGVRVRTAGGGAWAPLHSGPLTVSGAGTVTGDLTVGGTLSTGGLGCTGCIGTQHLAFDPATQAELSALQATLAPVATSGAYGDLDGAPDLSGFATLSGNNAFAGAVSVAGRLVLPKNAGEPFTCDASTAGAVYLDSSNGHFYGCNGLAFVQLDGGGSGGGGTSGVGTQDSPGFDCSQILAAGGSVGDGLYWIDPDGDGGATAFQVFCDMTMSGGGWTRITGDLIKTRSWITFTRVAGVAAWQGVWHDASSFVIGPTADTGATVRADVTLPFSFTQVRGDFTGAATTPAWHADENSLRSDWGGVPDGCEGWLTFGVPSQLMKLGGEWGGNFNQNGVSKQWTQPITVVPQTSVLRWENGQSCSPDERILVQNIVLYVRKPAEGTGPKGSLDNPALHCKDILDSGDSTGDGTYWIDPDGLGGAAAFLVTCDMTNDGGGWTRFPGDLLRSRGYVTFSKVAGAASTAGAWTDATTFVIGPTTADGGAERANAVLPFAFTGMRATWTGGALASDWNTDDNSARSSWGGAPSGCEGWLTFGTATLLHKKGGEWGGNYNQSGATRVWTMPATTVPSGQVVRWENAQDCSATERSTVGAIEVWVRP